MKTTALALLLASLSASLTSCTSSSSSTGGSGASSPVPTGLLGAVTGGLIGKLSDNIGNNNSSSVSGSTAVGTTTGTVSGSTTGTTSNGFFQQNQGLLTGAAAGFAGAEVTDAFRKGEIQKRYDEGYSKGKSDSVKDLYWLKRDSQRPKEGENDVHYRYYEVDVPAHTTSDGVLIERHRQVIEVVE